VADGAGWVRERDVRAALAAVEREVSAGVAERRPPVARGRLLRLRIALLATLHTDQLLADALAGLVDTLAEPPPPLG
jgi:hypothetical protein